MKTTVIGYPRIGEHRELKFAIERYWKGEIQQNELRNAAVELRKLQWLQQKEKGLDQIPSNTFSYYDMMLDTAQMLHAIPKEYQHLQLDSLDTYFAMARGYQGPKGDVKALSMKKWFNTNYHYLVPELDDDMIIELHADKLLYEYKEAKSYGIETRPVIYGPYTFLRLAKTTGKKKKQEYVHDIINAYKQLLVTCHKEGISWVQVDEPALVYDLTSQEIDVFTKMYELLLSVKGCTKVLLQTYFGDIRDSYESIIKLPFDALGLDFIEGKKNKELIETLGFPKDKILYAGLINGKNIWKTSYQKALQQLKEIQEHTNKIVLTTSCSLLHVPYTTRNEKLIDAGIIQLFAFAEEKLDELYELKQLIETDHAFEHEYYLRRETILKDALDRTCADVQKRLAALTKDDFVRYDKRADRLCYQKALLHLPILPTTTIGSFPQTREVKLNRSNLKKGIIQKEEYHQNIKNYIKECIELQEQLGIDVFVHGEYERNDMVEYFGEQLSGFVFTQLGWVQSYGTRCVKPPVIYSDIQRVHSMSVSFIQYAQSLTDKPVKGMLTGPVTILNWSFPREDITKEEITYQIALAIRDEVLDLEKVGIPIIQIDEAALREKLPLRKQDWHDEYLRWAIASFRLCHSGVKKGTQIHTHMCYSEFEDIIKEIDDMDADVITFEASRSKLTILDVLQQTQFATEVGPGVYDIHSPRVPAVQEICDVIDNLLKKVKKDNLWINPDCGLKTRNMDEAIKSLKHMVEATKIARKNIE